MKIVEITRKVRIHRVRLSVRLMKACHALGTPAHCAYYAILIVEHSLAVKAVGTVLFALTLIEAVALPEVGPD
jgi:hypothetical protein